MLVKFILINILLLLISGCTSKEYSSCTTYKHTINSSELRLMMRELNLVVDDRHESELERDSRRSRYALRLSDSIIEFSHRIKNTPKEKFDKNIDDLDMQIILKYANELEKQGEVIGLIAKNDETQRLDDAINNLKRTCKACHSSFRAY